MVIWCVCVFFLIGGACFCAAVFFFFLFFFIKVYLRVVFLNLGFKRRTTCSYVYLNIIHFIFDGRGMWWGSLFFEITGYFSKLGNSSVISGLHSLLKCPL